MAATAGENTVRACAQAIIAAIDGAAGDTARISGGVERALRRLGERADLPALGVARQGNNVASSYYLYLDDRMTILLFEVPKGKTIPPHDHGVWETLFCWRGRLRHTVYERADGGEVEGRATLRSIDDREMAAGECALVAPPADIHGFTALEDGTWGITVVDGHYKELRHYYDPVAGTVAVRRQTTAR